MLTREEALRFRALPPKKQRKLIESLAAVELLELDADFELYAHDDQHAPEQEGWRVWLMMAGRGFGKTRAGAEWVNRLAGKRGQRIALVAANIDEARAVMVEGSSGLLSVARKQRVRVKWEPSLKQLTWPSGSSAHLYSGDNADGLRGPEHAFAWFDEVEASPDPSVKGYRLCLSGSSTTIERDFAMTEATFSAAEVASLGTGPIEVQLRQIGTLMLSRPQIITIEA